jgi:UPF0042 nucleotide-binding protein
MRLIIVSGISGSGKSTFLKALEDIGYFCMDNFPLVLLSQFLELSERNMTSIDRCAMVIDVREKAFFDEGKKILKDVKERLNPELLFLDSSEDALIKRFRETRRSHPLYMTANIKEALKEERRLIGWIQCIADRVIDTSYLTPHELRRFVVENYSHTDRSMKINLVSFGYAYGLPFEADMVMDVRFLPNPFFIEGLKEKSGLSEDVGNFIASSDVFNKYFLLLLDFLLYLIPLFEKEGKSYLTICFGCTGGRHRSVFIVNRLAERLLEKGYNIYTIHRDIERTEEGGDR